MGRFIRYEAKGNRFFCCDEVVSMKTLGAMLAFALVRREKVLMPFCERDRTRDRHKRSMWCTAVSTNYVQQMLQFVADNGWFWDEVPEHVSRQDSDHDFDPDNITPSLNWRVVTEMQRGADLLDTQARRIDLEGAWHENRKRKALFDADAAQRRQRATALRESAAAMLAAGTPPVR